MALVPEYYTAGKFWLPNILSQVTTESAPNMALCLAQKQQKAQPNTYGKHFKPNINILAPTMYLFVFE